MRNVKLLSAAVLATTALGTALPVVANAAEDVNYNTTAGVTFTKNTDPTDPVNPDNPEPNKPIDPINPNDPDNPHQPGTNGPLSIDYVSDFNFGQQKISSKDMTYNAKAQYYSNDALAPTVLYAQVTDNRGTGQGWNLMVKQNDQLKTADGANTLTGAEISIKGMNAKTQASSEAGLVAAGSDINFVPGGAAVLAMNAPANAGQGTWVDRFGETSNVVDEAGTDEGVADRKVDNAVTLSVPGSTNKIAGQKYSTSLTWTLADTPSNTTV